MHCTVWNIWTCQMLFSPKASFFTYFMINSLVFWHEQILIEMSQCEKSFSKAWKSKPWSLWCWDEIGNHSASSGGTNGSQAGNSGMPPAPDIITDPLSLSILSDGLQHQVGSLSKFLQACKTSKPFSNQRQLDFRGLYTSNTFLYQLVTRWFQM